jgi:2-polyprenyl-3-methyl-5-hydroxy-6-metoxy-1,4-benzoquinol methylase
VPFHIGTKATLRRCRGCGLAYAAEVAAPDEIYVDGYLSGESDQGFGLDVTHPSFQEFLDFCGERRVHWTAPWAQPPGHWLDVGCGSGEVLGAVVRAGWQATGVEPVAASVQFAHQHRPSLDIRCSLLEDAGLPRRSFDVVSAFHVLEHMTDATGFLRMVARWARPGGLLVIEVPNVRSSHRRGWGGDWPGLRPLEHVSHFSPASLRATIARSDLDVVTIETHSFQYPRQTLDEMLADLGIHRWRRFLRRMGRPDMRDGLPASMPTPTGRWVLGAVEELYRRLGVGQVNFAIARVR